MKSARFVRGSDATHALENGCNFLPPSFAPLAPVACAMPPKKGAFPPVPAKCVVTGGSGFVGQRLVEMLVERGAQRVVSFDIAPKPADALNDPRIVYQQGDLTKPGDVLAACEARRRRASLH